MLRWAFVVLASASIVTAAGAAPPEIPAARGVKPAIRGLISMGAYRFVGQGGDPINTLAPVRAKPGIFDGIVIVASWNQLQPSADSGLEPNNAIDQALEEVRAYNAEYPKTPLAVKLRVWGGFVAPQWAIELGGGPIKVVHEEKERVIGHVWGPPYRKAWRNLQDMLAAKYDAEPLIHEVAITSCMMLTAEPFFVPTEKPEFMKPLRAAGFRDAPYRECLKSAVDDYAAWTRSRLVFSLNPFRKSDGGPTALDYAFTEEVMRSCRATLGQRCVFDNHNLDANPPKTILPVYDLIKQLGPEIEFQTYRKTPANFLATIRRGVELGASAIELWQDYGGFPEVEEAKLRHWAQLIKKNPTR